MFRVERRTERVTTAMQDQKNIAIPRKSATFVLRLGMVLQLRPLYSDGADTQYQTLPVDKSGRLHQECFLKVSLHGPIIC